MRPIWKLLIAVAVVIVLLGALLVIPHYRAKAALRAYERQLKQQGEKMSIGELTPSLSAEEIEAGRQLLSATGFFGSFTNAPPVLRWLGPGKALVSWQETISPTDRLTNCWPEFSATVKAHPEAVGQIAAALESAAFGFPVNYQLGYATLLPHLTNLRKAEAWLSATTVLALHEGDRSNAWNSVRLEADLVRKYNSEPLNISQQIRMTAMQKALGTTWEALQAHGWSDEQLRQLQTNWDSFTLLDRLEPGMGMERDMLRMELADMRKSFKDFDSMDPKKNYDSFDDVLTRPAEGIPGFFGKYPRFWVWKWWSSYDEELYTLQITQAAIETVRSARREDACYPALERFEQTATNLAKNHPGLERRFMIAQTLHESIKTFLLRAAVAETARRMMVTALALERHRSQHGKYPARLEELVPEYLSKVPVDFVDGKPLRYRRKEDGTFLLYSVGMNGKDDGGDGTPRENDMATFKNWTRMRDAVWPSPATADEVKEYETDMLKKVVTRSPGQLVPRMIIPPTTGTNAKTN